MPKYPLKQTAKRKTPEEVVGILAEKWEVTTRFIQLVISGEKTHEGILEDYMIYKQEHNLLLKAVKQVAPFVN